jgi:hypothetical protein
MQLVPRVVWGFSYWVEQQSMNPMLTIDDVAARLGVDRDAISVFIRSGELPAINVSRDPRGKRPTWRIRPEDLVAFELARRTVKTSVAPRARRTKQPTTRQWI